jgi:large subunit ribosomal protein L17
LGREKGLRDALYRNLATSLFKEEKITTSLAKAKGLRPFAEKLITKAKKKSPASIRAVKAELGTDFTVKKLFDVIAPRYEKRAGGYTRIVKLPRRMSDGSERAHIELV